LQAKCDQSLAPIVGIKQDGELRVAVALCGKSELATPARGLLVPGGGGGFEFA